MTTKAKKRSQPMELSRRSSARSCNQSWNRSMKRVTIERERDKPRQGAVAIILNCISPRGRWLHRLVRPGRASSRMNERSEALKHNDRKKIGRSQPKTHHRIRPMRRQKNGTIEARVTGKNVINRIVSENLCSSIHTTKTNHSQTGINHLRFSRAVTLPIQRRAKYARNVSK